jgi:hypothetical protein
LARYVDPNGKANPPRLLRYVLEDDPDTKALEKDIGLIGRTRRLFQAVDTIAREVRDERGKEGYADLADADWETPERIIIYIDDLDRCHEDKVYEVLAGHPPVAGLRPVRGGGGRRRQMGAGGAGQAVRDGGRPGRRGQRAAAQRARHALSGKDLPDPVLAAAAQQRRGRHLPALYRDAGRRVRRKTGQANQEAAERARLAAQSQRAGPKGSVGAGTASDAPEGAGHPARTLRLNGDLFHGLGRTPSEVKLVEARRKLQLTNAEIAFLGSPEIAALAATAPRGVKRLVNIYRIARARRGQEDGDAVLGADRAGRRSIR